MQLPSNANNIQVNGLSVNFTREQAKKLTEDAKLVPLEGNDTASWTAMGEKVEAKGALDSEDMSKLQNFAKASATGKDSLKKKLLDQLFGTSDPAVKDATRKKLSDVNVFMEGFDTLQDGLKFAGAKAAIAAVAGASFGPTGVLTAYQAFANLNQPDLKEVVDDIQGLREGNSPLIYEGNAVRQAHEEQLWLTMNQMLKAGVDSAQAGKKTPVSAQYYELTSQEIVGGLAANAKAGNPVHVNMDPARITPPPRKKEIELDDAPDKLRSVIQLVNAGCAVSTYPVNQQLGDPGDLMHRKLLRVGDEVLLSGMNANSGSGENIDRGYVMQGPAAHRKGEDFIRDVKVSLDHNTLDDRYSQKNIDGFPDNVVMMGRRGLTALMDAMSKDGPAPAGTPLERPTSFAEFKAYADKRGFDLVSLIDAPAADVPGHIDAMLNGGEKNVKLSKAGKELFLGLMERANDAVNSPENVKRFDNMEPPSDAKAGNTRVTLADVPSERQATALETIQNAERFIKAPTFVITKPIAAALAAKKQEMDAAGKPFDVLMVADSGVYPDGGTPNSTGIMLLEDAGITPRWTAIPRTGWHDRKIHAKDILTDKQEWFGSTNLSTKGMRENWEHSGVVDFDPKDPKSMEMRKHAEALFDELWEHFSFECNTKDLATYLVKDKFKYKGRDLDTEIDRMRGKKIPEILQKLEEFEVESGKFVEKQAENPKVKARIDELIKTGMDEGNAALVAVGESMGKEQFYSAIENLPSRKALRFLPAPKPKS